MAARFAGCLLAVVVVLSGGRLAAEDTAVAAAKEAFQNLAKSGKFLDICTQFQGMKTSSCVGAAKAGDGANCPTTRRAKGGEVEVCKLSIFSELSASLNASVRAKLEASSLRTAEMYAKITPKESVVHTHSTVSDPAATCGPYIARVDFVNFRFALFDSASVSLGISTPQYGDFEAQVKNSEGETYSYDSLMCGRIDHEGTCGPVKTTTLVVPTPEGEGRPTAQPPKEPAETPTSTSGGGNVQPTPLPPPAPPTDRSQTALAGKAQIFVAGEVASEDEMAVTVRGPSTFEGMVVSAESGGAKTEARVDSKGHAVLKIAGLAGGAAAAVAAIRAFNPAHQEIAQAQTRITPGPVVSAPPQVPNLPALLRNGDVVTIPGKQLGAEAQLVVGNRAQETLAASSKELTAFVDAPATGPQSAYVLTPNGRSESQTVHSYNLQVAAPQNTIVRGQHVAAVAHYEGLPPGSQIEFTNASPAVVKMKVPGASLSQGEKSVYTVSQPTGSCQVEMVGKSKGAFVINYQVRPPKENPGQPPQ